MTRSNFLRNFKDFIVITLGALASAAAIFFFMLPSNVAIGSASALAMVLNNFIPVPVSVLALSTLRLPPVALRT